MLLLIESSKMRKVANRTAAFRLAVQALASNTFVSCSDCFPISPPRGYLLLTTGDVSSLLPRLQGKAWHLIHPPTHVHYSSRKTITSLLKRLQFEVVDIKYPDVWRSDRQLMRS